MVQDVLNVGTNGEPNRLVVVEGLAEREIEALVPRTIEAVTPNIAERICVRCLIRVCVEVRLQSTVRWYRIPNEVRT